MWVRIPDSYVNCIFLVLTEVIFTQCHIPSYLSTPSSKIEQFCELAESCVHDTIPVCGRMGEEKRSFLDICDLLEYACDTDNIYTHIEDEIGCPVDRPRPED